MSESKKETTLRCVMTLTIIALICGLLLAILNPLLYVEPSADDIIKNFKTEATVTGTVETLDKELAKGAGGKVLLVAELDENGKKYVGMTIKTNSDAQLGECVFAIYFDKTTNKIVQGCYVTDGSTGGKSYAVYGDKGANFEDYLVVVDKADVFGSYTYPKTGATKTVKAVNNAFIIASNYYYTKYVKGV